jgi:hypothetical protein
MANKIKPSRESPGICSEPGCTEPALAPFNLCRRDRHLCLCRKHYMPNELTPDERECVMYSRKSAISEFARSRRNQVTCPSREELIRARKAMEKSGIRVLDYHGVLSGEVRQRARNDGQK